MSNYNDELIQREMYKALYGSKKKTVKSLEQAAKDFLWKNRVSVCKLPEVDPILVMGKGENPVLLFELLAKFAKTIQEGLIWIPTDQEMPENLQWCLVCVVDVQSKEKYLSIAVYTNGYGLYSNGEYGVYHEGDDEYYCPEGFYEFGSDDEEVHYHIDPADKKVTHFIPRDFIALP